MKISNQELQQKSDMIWPNMNQALATTCYSAINF